MHGRPRVPVDQPEDPEKLKASKQRLALFSRLSNEVLARRAAKRYDAESMALAGKLLEQNPEVYTVWNYRREALKDTFLGKHGQEAAEKAVRAELGLSQAALTKNPKSYAAWHQRKWLVQLGVVDLDRELELVTRLLEADKRNFHGWAYRRVVAERAGVPAAQEEQYSMDCINSNFSNYSAWHARTSLLPRLHAAQPTVSLSDLLAADAAGAAPPQEPPSDSLVPSWALQQEFDLVEQATFTDPNDQSAWIYHRWLLSQLMAHHKAASTSAEEATAQRALEESLQQEIQRCETLLESEPDRSKCKWPLLTLARLLELQAGLSGGTAGGRLAERAKDLYKELMLVDPLREGFYQDARDGHAAVVTRAI